MSGIKLGVGEWKTRFGLRAVVLGRQPCSNNYPWVGYEFTKCGSTNAACWTEDCRIYIDSETGSDIIAPWTSPIAPKKRLIRVEELPPVCWVGCSDCCSLVTRRSEDKIGFPHSPDMSIRELHYDRGDKWSSDLSTWNPFEVEDKQ